jgi:hypothetical protein
MFDYIILKKLAFVFLKNENSVVQTWRCVFYGFGFAAVAKS